mgnify:CR=1 FL=1
MLLSEDAYEWNMYTDGDDANDNDDDDDKHSGVPWWCPVW